MISIGRKRHGPSLISTVANLGPERGKKEEFCLNPDRSHSWDPGCPQSFSGDCGEGCIGGTVYRCDISWRMGVSSQQREDYLQRCYPRGGLRRWILGSDITLLTIGPRKAWNSCNLAPMF